MGVAFEGKERVFHQNILRGDNFLNDGNLKIEYFEIEEFLNSKAILLLGDIREGFSKASQFLMRNSKGGYSYKLHSSAKVFFHERGFDVLVSKYFLGMNVEKKTN